MASDRPHVDMRGARAGRDVIGVQNNHYEVRAPAPQSVRALPAQPFGFTGREAELRELEQALDPSGEGQDRPRAVAIAGLGGMGKTALALTLGHRMVGEGRPFSGALFLDLHGYSPGTEPVCPGQALDQLLRALGVRPQDLPHTIQEKGALYRSELVGAQEGRGRPLLVMIDNAANADQVLPLVPGQGDSRMLVTSRKRLHLLHGARHLSLDALSRDECLRLLVRTLATANPQDPRVGQQQGLERLAEACAGLPLALRIMGAVMVRSRRRTPASLADRLEPGKRVGQLQDDQDSLAVLFDLSLRELTPEQVEVFRLLAAGQGADISTHAALALTGLDEEELLEILEELVAAHLVSDDVDTDRWSMHDLITEHANLRWDTAPPSQITTRDEALSRLLEYYVSSTIAAASVLGGVDAPPDPPRFPSRANARTWLAGERANLIAAAKTLHVSGHWQIPVLLARWLHRFLLSERHLEENLALQRIGLEAAGNQGDQRAAITTEGNIGETLVRSRRYTEALPLLERVSVLSHEAGDIRGMIGPLNHIGQALQGLGRFDKARRCLESALYLAQRHGFDSEANTRHSLGALNLAEEDFAGAIDQFRHAHALFLSQHDPEGAAGTLTGLGAALSGSGRPQDASRALGAALALWGGEGHPPSETFTRAAVGSHLMRTGEFEQARTVWEEALTQARRAGDRHLEATVLNNLSTALMMLGRPGEAVPRLQRCARLLHEVGDRGAERQALRNLRVAEAARVRLLTGDDSGEDVPAHAGEQGQDHDEQDRADEPRPPL